MNLPRNARDRQFILNRVKAENMHGCWIWNGPMTSLGRATQHFAASEHHKAYTITIAQFLYQEAYKVTLEPHIFFHFCPISDRCVNPTHNYPTNGCDCDRCASRKGFGKGWRKQPKREVITKPPKPATSRKAAIRWRYHYESPGGGEVDIVFPMRDMADTYALAHIQTLYQTTDIYAAQEQHGFKWSITKEAS